MEKHSQAQPGELLAQGKVARVDAFPCGHIILTFESFRVGFHPDDFQDFANTLAMAASHIACRDAERAEWGLFM